MASEKISQLLIIAQTALTNKDKKTLDKTLYEILKTDIHVEEAWAILYAYYGNGKPYDQFKESFIQQYFPDQLQPQPKEAPSRHSSLLANPSPVQIPEPLASLPPLVRTPNPERGRSVPDNPPASEKSPTRPRKTQPLSPVANPSPVRIPEPLPASPPLVSSPGTDGQNPAQIYCNFCGVPFSSRADVIRHIERWHPTISNQPAQPEQKPAPTPIPGPVITLVPAPVPAPAPTQVIVEENNYGSKKTPWGWIIFFICVVVGAVIAIIAFWPSIQQFLGILVLVLFFPIILPLALLLAGGFYSIIYGPNWMLRAGMYLLGKRWWWFPVGWIVGSVFFLCRLNG